jgi:hypothetical protein
MKLRSVAPQWFSDDPMKTAKCVLFPATADYDPWYNESDDPEAVDESEEAKKICNGTDDGRPCPLREQCLEFAVVNNERWGVWGGMTPDERAQVRKDRRVWQRSVRGGDQN